MVLQDAKTLTVWKMCLRELTIRVNQQGDESLVMAEMTFDTRRPTPDLLDQVFTAALSLVNVCLLRSQRGRLFRGFLWQSFCTARSEICWQASEDTVGGIIPQKISHIQCCTHKKYMPGAAMKAKRRTRIPDRNLALEGRSYESQESPRPWLRSFVSTSR